VNKRESSINLIRNGQCHLYRNVKILEKFVEDQLGFPYFSSRFPHNLHMKSGNVNEENKYCLFTLNGRLNQYKDYILMLITSVLYKPISKVLFLIVCLRDRPYNLQGAGGIWGFFFVQKSWNICFFVARSAKFFSRI